MARKVLILLTAISLLAAPVLTQVIYSGTLTEPQQRVKVDGEVIRGFSAQFNRENLSIRITQVNKTLERLQVYRAYTLETSSNNSILSLNLTVDVRSWMNATGLEENEIAVVEGGTFYTAILQDGGSYSYAKVPRIPSQTTLYIAGTENLYEKLSLAVNPEKTVCGVYLDPSQNFEKVNTCIGRLNPESGGSENSSNSDSSDSRRLGKLVLIASGALGILILLTASAVLLRKHRESTRGEEIAEITENLIDRMESGEIERDKEFLKELEKSNQLAYNGEYAQANKILEKVKKQLKNR